MVMEISGGTQEQPVGRIAIVTKSILKQLDNQIESRNSISIPQNQTTTQIKEHKARPFFVKKC